MYFNSEKHISSCILLNDKKQFKFHKLVKFIIIHRNIVVEERTVDPGLINAITPYYKSYLLSPFSTNSPAVLLPGRDLQIP